MVARFMRLGRIGATLAALSWATAAVASEQSEMLYSRGLVEFHGQRYVQAIQWFDQAVAADNGDANALYYRAMARARLEQRAQAIEDLRLAIQLQPDFERAQLELAAVLIDDGQYDAALAVLDQVRRTPGNEGKAHFLTGLAQLRQDRLEESRSSFRAAAAADPQLAATASYYEGVIAYRNNESGRARTLLSESAQKSQGKAIGREAAAFLQSMDSRAGGRSYMLYAEAGLQYDSNVCLVPDDQQNGCSALDSPTLGSSTGGDRQEDGRGVFTLGGLYHPYSSDTLDLSIGYEFFQSAHFELDEFNLQDHRPRVQLTADVGPFLTGILGQYDYYTLDADSFLNEYNALPWVIVPEGDFGRTEVYYRMRYRDFDLENFGIRSGFNHAVAFRQAFYLAAVDRYVFVGYRYDSEDPKDRFDDSTGHDAQEFAYDGHEASAGLRWAFPRAVPLELSAAYRNERYAKASQPAFNRRNDNEFRARAYAEIPWALFAPDTEFAQYVSFGLGYSFTLNDSDQSQFDFNRHIASATVLVRY